MIINSPPGSFARRPRATLPDVKISPSRMTFQESLGKRAVRTPSRREASPRACGVTSWGRARVLVALGSSCSSTRCSTTS